MTGPFQAAALAMSLKLQPLPGPFQAAKSCAAALLLRFRSHRNNVSSAIGP